MKFFRLDLLTLLISLFILNSCKNESSIGLAVNQSKQLSGSIIDSATIITNTIPEGDGGGDSVATSELPKTPLAWFKDPTFGTTEANIIAQLNLPGSAAYSLPTGTVTIDSALLVLRYSPSFYGDSLTSKYKLNIYQLSDKPKNSTTYYSNQHWNYNSNTVIGTVMFNARPRSAIKIFNIIAGATDTMYSVPAQLRVPVSKNFIAQNLFETSNTALNSNTVFANQVKGFFITLDKNQSTGPGGNMYFEVDSSHLDVYIRANNNGTIDTSIVSLPLSNHSAQIIHTYTSSINVALQNSAANPKANQEVVYFAGLGGTRVKISFPYLANIVKTVGSDIILNRAELVITPVPGSVIPFPPQPKLSLYRWDIAHQRVEVPDAMGGTNATAVDPRFISVATFGGFYNSVEQDYHFVITGYIQDLMRGKTVDYGTFIGPVDTTNTSTVDIAATSAAYGRAVTVGGVINKASANYPYRMKLNIIYTKITQ